MMIKNRQYENTFTEGPYKGKRVEDVIESDPDFVVHTYLTYPNQGGVTANQYDKAIATLGDLGTSTWDYEPEDIDYLQAFTHRLRHDYRGGYYNPYSW